MAQLDHSAIIIIVIVGCLVSVLMGYSIHYIATNGFHGEEPQEMSQDQRQYMRELRQKTLHWMARDARLQRDIETPATMESGYYQGK